MQRKLINFFSYSVCLSAIGAAACGGDGSDDVEPEPTERVGYVAVGNPGFLRGPADEPYIAKAGFLGNFESADQRRGVECVKEAFGACELVDCTQVKRPAAAGRSPVFYRAGRITIEGGLRPLAIEPSEGAVEGADEAFRGGERLTLRAEGGEVPAFEGSLLAPADLTLSEPLPSADATPTFTFGTDRDATFRWTGGVAGTTFSVEFGRSGVAGTTGATCRFDAGAGSGVVPAAMLERLSRVTPDLNLFLLVESKQQIIAGAFAIDFQAHAQAVDSNGVRVWGAVRFEE